MIVLLMWRTLLCILRSRSVDMTYYLFLMVVNWMTMMKMLMMMLCTRRYLKCVIGCVLFLETGLL